jgi:hypothetical protein
MAHTSIPITIKICHTAIPPYRQEMIPNFGFLFVDVFLDSSDKLLKIKNTPSHKFQSRL